MKPTISYPDSAITRRHVLSTAVATGCSAMPAAAWVQTVIRLEDFGGSVCAGATTNRRALQTALDRLARSGGTLRIDGRYRCGDVMLNGRGVTIDGTHGTLLDSRVTVASGASNFVIVGLTMIDTRGDRRRYQLDIAGQNGLIENVSVIKDPVAGGYQMYVRPTSRDCTFCNLTLRGSNGVFVAGRRHRFDGFDFTSTMSRNVGGDDAFALKGPNTDTSDIIISNGIARGFSAIVSIGSEVGHSPDRKAGPGSVRNVTITNVRAEKCSRILFIKVGALDYDWRGGTVENIQLIGARLDDPTGFLMQSGIVISAARGALVRGVNARNVVISARAEKQAKAPTSAIDINIRKLGAPARIENVDLTVWFVDPHGGAPRGPGIVGYPIDHIVRIEKGSPDWGVMRDISLDVTGYGSRFGGVYVGAGLDGVVNFRNLQLSAVALNPPSSLGGGAIWSDSRVALGAVNVRGVSPKNVYAGSAFKRR